ncbi:DUF4179 domain-containing protein [Paenibacillus sp. FSL K6-1330]|uniref:DUF4179 domain-containing protein n=1 Tax=Paenibacillus sp. FSL K6-1330 TaxID=2975292 RepID=UPI0030D71558
MLNQDERQLKKNIQQSLDEIPLPDSLIQFAKEVPLCYQQPEEDMVVTKPRQRSGRRRYTIAAACMVLALSLGFTVQKSPALAAMVKGIPGFSIVSDWLDTLRGHDGVENAQSHGYSPFEPVVKQFDGVTVSISDVYLTSDRLSYKVFIKSDRLKQHVFKRQDGSLDLNREAPIYSVNIPEIADGGSSASVVIESSGDAKEPILVISRIGEVNPEDVNMFLNQNPKELQFEIGIRPYVDEDGKQTTDTLKMSVPFHHTDWLEDRIIPIHQTVKVAGDPDLREMTLEHIKITPTNTYLDIKIADEANYYLLFGHSGAAPFVTDDKGKKYQLHTDTPQNMVDVPGGKRMNGNKLMFTGSPYFDESVNSLTLHLDQVLLTEKSPGGSFTLSLDETYPKKVRFKDQELTIIGASYKNDYLRLKIKKESNDHNKRLGILFAMYPEAKGSLNPELQERFDKGIGIDSGEARVRSEQDDYYEVRVFAPKLETYEIVMYREAAPVRINQDITIPIRSLR